MIVTVCGAYRNAGDHLIGERARALLRAFVEPDVVTVDRRAITEEHYAYFNKARAVLLTGGPAYQREMYPKVYPIELDRITVPVLPYGLGWKSAVGKSPKAFKFTPPTNAFINELHSRIEFGSVRDPLTAEVLAENGAGNALMTGCPAWYDLNFFEKSYAFNPDPKTVVLSMPAIMQPGVYELMEWLTRRFPRARRVASFHHGVIPNTTKRGRATARDFIAFSARAALKGWRISSLANSLPKMEALYGAADLHVGYRVHAHLFCLSRRISSILINEDTRGVGQAMALRAKSLVVDGGNIEPITTEIDAHFNNRGEGVERAIATMRATFPTMRRFLATV